MCNADCLCKDKDDGCGSDFPDKCGFKKDSLYKCTGKLFPTLPLRLNANGAAISNLGRTSATPTAYARIQTTSAGPYSLPNATSIPVLSTSVQALWPILRLQLFVQRVAISRMDHTRATSIAYARIKTTSADPYSQPNAASIPVLFTSALPLSPNLRPRSFV